MSLPGFPVETRRDDKWVVSRNDMTDHASSHSSAEVVVPQSCPWYVWAGCATKLSFCTSLCATHGPGAIICMPQCLIMTGATLCYSCIQ